MKSASPNTPPSQQRTLSIPIRDISVSPSRRAVRNVSELADSIKELGLLNPITVTEGFRLIAGGNRIEACKSLGWSEIPANVVKLDSLHAELAEIDENLVRNELSVLERSEQLARRKEIYEAIHPGTINPAERGGPGRGNKKTTADPAVVLIPDAVTPSTPCFVSDTAKKTGQSERSVYQDVQIAKSITGDVREAIRDTPLADRKDDLVRLARMEPEQQKAVVEAIAASPIPITVPQAQRAVARDEKRIALETRAEEARQAVSPTKPQWNIVIGDCVDVLRTIEPASVRLIFADPPYNIGINYGDHHNDKMEDEEFIDWCQSWADLSAKALTADGSMWVLIGDEYADFMGIILRDAGLHRRSWIKWYESFGVNTSNNFNRCSRHLFYCVKDKDNFIFNPDAVNRPSDRQAKYGDKRADSNGKVWDNVWGLNPEIPRLVDNSRERIPDFPTQLPLALLRAVVGCASEPGDLVLDPFNGSGTTGEASIQLGRRYIGIEKGERFAALAKLRLTAAKEESTNAA